MKVKVKLTFEIDATILIKKKCEEEIKNLIKQKTSLLEDEEKEHITNILANELNINSKEIQIKNENYEIAKE